MAMFAEYQPRTDAMARLPRVGVGSVTQATGEHAASIARLTAERHDVPYDEVLERTEREVLELGDGGHALFVSLVDGAVAGFGRAGRLDAEGGMPAGWYLIGVIADPSLRRRGVATALIQARMGWIAERADEAYYFARATNRTTIDLHAPFGFEEVTRDFVHADANLNRGEGALFRVLLQRP